MPRFRKRPVIVEARQFCPSAQDGKELAEWCGGVLASWETPMHIRVSTLEGDMLAMPDDWVIRGIKGEFYPCKPDIFEATYERYEEVIPGGWERVPMTSDELVEARKLAEAATPGPWTPDEGSSFDDSDYRNWLAELTVSGGRRGANAAFIAAARTLLPKVLDEVERLTAENASDRAIQGDAEHRALDRAEAAERRAREADVMYLKARSDGQWQIRAEAAESSAATLAAERDLARAEVERLAPLRMTNGDLIDELVKRAKEYAADAPASLERNQHMHRYRGFADHELIRAVVVGFVNHVIGYRGGDLGLYTRDIDDGRRALEGGV